MLTLEKIDQVVNRTGVSYKEAKEALELNNSDVISAIIFLENKQENDYSESNFKASDILETIKEYIRRGNVSRIIIKKNEETVLNIPVNVGAITVVLAPILPIIGIGAAVVLKDIKVYIIKHDGQIVNINEVTSNKLNNIKEKTENLKNTAERKANDFKEQFSKSKEDKSEESIVLEEDKNIENE